MNSDYFLKNKPQAIFFDFDGVVLESSNIKTQAFVELFSHLPKEQQNAIHDYHVSNMGVSRFKKFEWIYATLLNKELSEEESKALGEGFSKIVYQKILEAPFVPGVKDLLEWANQNTINFVASGTPEEELRKVVKARDLQSYFTGVYGSPSTKENIVNEMIKKHRLERGRCWFIGDATTDYKAALATELNFIARNTAEFNEYWKAQRDIIIVEDFSELLKR